MPVIDIQTEGNGGGYADVFRRCPSLIMPEDIPIRMETLDGGMSSGKPSVAFILELPGIGRTVLAQTSVRLFQMAVYATMAKYGDLTDGAVMGRFSPGGRKAELTLSDEVACGSCSAHIPSSCRFCPECGAKL